MKRRRFLQIVAAAVAAPGMASAAAEWRGRALGADAAIALHGPGAAEALAELTPLLAQVEVVFSLHRPSELTELNAQGACRPSPWMAEVLALADRLNRLTGGAFDPTVQPLWRALAEGGDLAAARALLGWDRVRIGTGRVVLDKGQALTLNGIAQGFATDLLRDRLAAQGFTQALVNIGEYAALGGPFRLGIEDPVAGLLATRALRSGALAVSSPGAMQLGGQGHILHPRGLPPRWSTVAVEADRAALADGLATALVFADLAQVTRLRAEVPGLRAVMLVDAAGDLRTI